ncbi:MAG: 3-phosphoserine/phosphohydroxythreonine transaminase [Clostridia bacterium]|nr:3-phosphoserine/phosphohydroxythreonine transaminase [Clostridia bacterium]
MERKLNFSAGPSQMPLEVLKEMQDEFLCYKESGCSVLEMSHRAKDFEEIIFGARDTLRRIMEIPEDYEILFMQGGATTQFSMVPMNLAKQGDTFTYVNTGQFAGKAKDEGARWGNAVVTASSKDKTFSYIPDEITVAPGSKFIHITGNNTIYGTSYNSLFDHGDTPLVADWSSAILGKWIDVKDYDLIYAGAQKNMGPSGLAVVIIKKNLLELEVDPVVPVMMRYKVAADNDSMYNTPPTYSIYAAGKMFSWVEKMGGVRALEEINKEKAEMLYDFIDNSALFTNPVRVKDRSIMNVTFTLPDEALTKAFLDECKMKGIINIKGHRSVGGMRASIYNGMPKEGVKTLLDTMKEFEKNNR